MAPIIIIVTFFKNFIKIFLFVLFNGIDYKLILSCQLVCLFNALLDKLTFVNVIRVWNWWLALRFQKFLPLPFENVYPHVVLANTFSTRYQQLYNLCYVWFGNNTTKNFWLAMNEYFCLDFGVQSKLSWFGPSFCMFCCTFSRLFLLFT